MPATEPLAGWSNEARDELLALAELASLATWIEPGLLRRLRLDRTLLPPTDAGLEARLWFSPLVQVQNASGFALHPDVRVWLRERLALKPDRLQAVWNHVAAAHANAPPTVRTEEEVTFLGLTGAETDRIEARLRTVLAALVDQGRSGLASWAARALPLFPPIVRSTETAWLLAVAASKELGGSPVFEGEEAARRLDPAKLRRVLGTAERAFLGVRWLEDGIEFGPPELPGAKVISVPRASPVMLEVQPVTSPGTPDGPMSVSFNLGERRRIPWAAPSAPTACILHADLDRQLTHDLRRALTAAGIDLNLQFGGGSVHLDRLEEHLAKGNPIPASEIPTVLEQIGPETRVIVIGTPGWLKAGSAHSALSRFVQRAGGRHVLVVEDHHGRASQVRSPFSGWPVRMLDGDIRNAETIQAVLAWAQPAAPHPTEIRIETLLQERHVLRPLDLSVELTPSLRALRDRLTRAGPKRILSLEGGGVRTASSFGFLRQMEAVLGRRAGGREFRLADYFDLIGGCSAGGVIAACLALRMSVQETESVWIRFVTSVFGRKSNLLRRLQQRFDDTALNRSLAEVFGNRTLTDEAMATGLCLVVKRMDTGETVSLTNHPSSRYFAQRRTVMLRDALRAALAAPTLFAPVRLALGTEVPGVYMDAGATVNVDPSWHLFRLATSRRHAFGWQPGAEDLLLVSVGAGTWRETQSAGDIAGEGLVRWTAGLTNRLLRNSRRHTASLLESAGRILTRPRTPGAEMFDEPARLSYVRYTIELEPAALSALGFSDLAGATDALRAVDDPEQVQALQRIGHAAAEREMRDEHFPPGFDRREDAPPPSDTSSFVFLSYAGEDRALARNIRDQFDERGIRIRWADPEMNPTRIPRDLEEAIQHCTTFVALISQHALSRQAGRHRREWELAIERTRRGEQSRGGFLIVPLLHREIQPTDPRLPPDFARWQMVQLAEDRLPPSFFERFERAQAAS